MGISLCMIVKNEEDWIAGAVESVRSIVSEVIIVDTGSTDKTPERVRELGVNPLKFQWKDSFAEARNVSLAQARDAAGQNAVCWLKSQVPARVENTCCVSGVKGAGVTEPRKGRDGALEFGIDRFGGDYRNFETVPNAIGKTCADACWADQRCRAWTYARPGYQGPARCWLKDRLTMPRRVPCCVSGVVR